MTRFVAILLAAAFGTSAMADSHISGDAAKGEAGFNKCRACHAIITPEGEAIIKGGKTGPNLYGIVGRVAGSTDYNYGSDLVAAGEKGLVWDEEQFVAYVTDPREFLRGYLDDSKAKAKMTFKLKAGGEDIYAYLASVGPK